MNKERLKEIGRRSLEITKRILIILGVFLGVIVLFAAMGAAVYGVLAWEGRRDTPINRRAAVESARVAGQLAPLPVGTDALEFKALGGPLQRRYQLAFEAEPAVLQAWVDRSAGLAGLRRPQGAKAERSVTAHGIDGKGSCKVTWSQNGHRIALDVAED